MNGNKELVKLLIDKNCNKDVKDVYGNTPIHMACGNGKEEMVKLLLDNNCNINVKNVNGDAPIHMACANGSLETVKLLLENNCILESLNNDNKTPLQLVKVEKHLLIAEMLIKKNIDLKFTEEQMTYLKSGQVILSSNMIVYLEFQKFSCLDKCQLLNNIQDLALKLYMDNKNSFLNVYIKEFKIAKTNVKLTQCNKLLALMGVIERNCLEEPYQNIVKHRDRFAKRHLFLQPNTKRIIKISKMMCMVCYIEPIKRRINCGHLFCRSCSVNLNKCPVCRYPLHSKNNFVEICV